jgi:hypothetical protein
MRTSMNPLRAAAAIMARSVAARATGSEANSELMSIDAITLFTADCS